MKMALERLSLYMSYPFVRYALIVGVLIALSAALLGVILVLRRFSFIGDGLSHVAFGSMAIAAVLNLTSDLTFTLFTTTIAAVILLKSGSNTKLKGDSTIAILSVSSLAIGYLLMNIFSSSSNISGDVCSSLFGSISILTLTKEEVLLCMVLSSIVVGTFILFYNKIFAVSFDEDFAYVMGTRVKTYNLILAIITAATIVLAMNLVGSLLISALVIFPAISAMALFKNFKLVIIASGLISVISAFVGIILSILGSTPVGSTIVVVNICIFLISTCLRRIRS